MMRVLFSISFLSIVLSVYGQMTDTSKAFAHNLYKRGQYQFASLEYQRLLFYDPSDTSVRWLFLRSLNMSGQYNSCLSSFEEIHPEFKNTTNDEVYQYGIALLHLYKHDTLNVILSNKSLLSKEQYLSLSASQLIVQGQYLFSFALLEKNNNNNRNLIRLKELSNEALNTRFKSPGIAAGMSALLPGAGQCYSNHWREGIVTLLATMLSGVKVYSDFRDGRTTSAYIYGASFSVLYLYGILSGVENAHNHNRSIRSNYEKSVFNIIDNPN